MVTNTNLLVCIYDTKLLVLIAFVFVASTMATQLLFCIFFVSYYDVVVVMMKTVEVNSVLLTTLNFIIFGFIFAFMAMMRTMVNFSRLHRRQLLKHENEDGSIGGLATVYLSMLTMIQGLQLPTSKVFKDFKDDKSKIYVTAGQNRRLIQYILS